MNRRRILQLTGATFATSTAVGHVQGQEAEDDGRQQGEDDNGETPAEDEATGDDDTEDEETPPEQTCKADVHFGRQELLIDESGVSPTAYAAVTIENVGDAASGALSVTAEWLDTEGSFLDDDSERLPTLGAGETWHAFVRAFPDPAAIDDVVVTGEFESDTPRQPHGMSIVESSFDPGENLITGVVENTRDEAIEGVEAHGRIYAGDTVVGGNSDWEGELPAGTDWSFEIRTPILPAGIEPDEHAVELDARSYRIRDR